MNSGYTLKKLEYEAYGKSKTTTTKNGDRTETVTQNPLIRKTFKNGGSVPAPKYRQPQSDQYPGTKMSV